MDSIEDTEDAEGSVFIAGYCGRVIFGVKNGKTYRCSWVSGRPLPQSGGVPFELSVVWALLAHLKVEPLVQEMLLVKPVVGEIPLCVVPLDEILSDRRGFPQG
jgi:hypothetical protein